MKVVSQKDCDITEIVSALTRGETIVYPTETCYGLGCDATSQKAVDMIYRIKGREGGKPCIVLMPDIATVRRYVSWNGMLDRIAAAYWPGALTVVGLAKEGCGLAAGVVAADGTVAVRISAYPFAHALTSALGGPLVSTSANLAGGENIYDPTKIIGIFLERSPAPDMFIDAGVLPMNTPTTVVSIMGEKMEVMRQGGVRVS